MIKLASMVGLAMALGGALAAPAAQGAQRCVTKTA